MLVRKLKELISVSMLLKTLIPVGVLVILLLLVFADCTGPEGSQGVRGPQGGKGDTGAQGIQGPRGVQGYTGPTGATGSQGAAGAQGETGPKGDPGYASNRAIPATTTITSLDTGGSVGSYSSITIGTDGLGLISY